MIADEKIERWVRKEDIKAGLRKSDLKKGDSLGVHSSLSSFGRVEGGADAVIDALLLLDRISVQPTSVGVCVHGNYI